MRFFFAALAAALLCQFAQAQRTIRVPGEAPTIQAGINMAQAGDTVLLADGVYRGAGNKSLTMRPIDITVRSEGGAAACVIDLEGSGRAMQFYQGQTAGYVVEGITFRNGNKPDRGGAIWISGASPTVRDCVFEDCVSQNGGAIALEESASRLVKCIFRRCGVRATEHIGGGVLAVGGVLTVNRCAFESCEAEHGAGAAILGGHADFIDTTLDSGIATRGAALWVGEGASAVLVGCRVADNETAAFDGGAIHLLGAMSVRETEFLRNIGPGMYSEGDVDVADCVVADHEGSGLYLRRNSAIRDCDFDRNGAGVYFFYTGRGIVHGTVERCEFRGNVLGLGASEMSPSVQHCTFVDNETAAAGGGSRYAYGPRFEHCEFTGNQRGLPGYTSASDSTFTGNGPDFTVSRGDYDRCKFVGNTARATLFQGETTLRGCLVAGNRTTETGHRASVVASGSFLSINNSTIVGNVGPASVPAILVAGTVGMTGEPVFGSLRVRNSIIDGQAPIIRAMHSEMTYPIATATVEIDFSVAPGGRDAVELSAYSELVWGAGNIAADPRLADPAGGDYSPAPGSPCIDAGDNTRHDEPLDLAGLPRFRDDAGTPDRGQPDPARPELAIVDIGAYEFQGESPCRADLDGDGELTFFDFIAFQELFGAGDARADFDFDGELTFFDFLGFQEGFVGGCA